MAEGNGDEGTKPGMTFVTGLIAGVVIVIVVALVGFVTVGEELGIPVLVLGAICVVAALAYRIIGTSGPKASNDPGGSSIPQLDADAGRPIGDTQEAHDELNPHDIPKDSPVRAEAVAQAGHEGTTTGNEEGGAAGRGGSEEGDQDAVSSEEAAGGAQTTGRD
jgi:hypothetical protein